MTDRKVVGSASSPAAEGITAIAAQGSKSVGTTAATLRKLYRFLKFVEPIGILVAVAALVADLLGQHAEHVVSAWQLIATKASGNSGKVEALEYLNGKDWWGRHRAALMGIDLRAPAEDAAGAYLAAVDLEEADLQDARFDRAILQEANLSNTLLDGTSFAGADLRKSKLAMTKDTIVMRGVPPEEGWAKRGTNFARALLDEADFSGRDFESCTLAGATGIDIHADQTVFTDCDFENSSLRFAEGGPASFKSGNVSGAWLQQTGNRPIRGWVWAYATKPPEALPMSLTYIECAEEAEVGNALAWSVNDEGSRPTFDLPAGCSIKRHGTLQKEPFVNWYLRTESDRRDE